MSLSSSEEEEERNTAAVAVENNLHKLMSEVEVMEGQIKNIIVSLNKPVPEETERVEIWRAVGLIETLTIFDMREVFQRLKPFSIKRKEGLNWFQWMYWVMWG
jgi:hypothetical protein